ncbi:15516_t:CDS:2 [Funneliformis geosporum]|uniref:15516_t:CDS:1 n=1 Tax=Funneliformis geosporum TaxID=1117311 RepID=A0A9W4SL15_9GLOM|nr:15516_t:CDS:2 [Funneliformis geosporum]
MIIRRLKIKIRTCKFSGGNYVDRRSLSSYTRSSVGLKDEWIIELGFKDMKEMFDSAICEITRLIVNILN